MLALSPNYISPPPPSLPHSPLGSFPEQLRFLLHYTEPKWTHGFISYQIKLDWTGLDWNGSPATGDFSRMVNFS